MEDEAGGGGVEAARGADEAGTAGRGRGWGAATGSSKSVEASAAIAGRRRQYQTPAPAAASPASSHAQIGGLPVPSDGDTAALSDGGATATGAVGSFENPGAAVGTVSLTGDDARSGAPADAEAAGAGSA